jgi:hypothetical protein
MAQLVFVLGAGAAVVPMVFPKPGGGGMMMVWPAAAAAGLLCGQTSREEEGL